MVSLGAGQWRKIFVLQKPLACHTILFSKYLFQYPLVLLVKILVVSGRQSSDHLSHQNLQKYLR